MALVVPDVVFHEHDDKVARDHADDASGHVHHRDGAEAHLADLSKSINLTDTFDDLNLLWILLENFLDAEFAVLFWHVIPEQGHLLHPDRVVIQAAVDRFGHGQRHADCEHCRQEVVD